MKVTNNVNRDSDVEVVPAAAAMDVQDSNEINQIMKCTFVEQKVEGEK